MILISKRKTSPGTSPMREAVNKVTCSRSSPGGSSGQGPRASRRAAKGFHTPRPAVPRRGQEPRVCFLRVGDLLEGWDRARKLSYAPLLLFSSWAPSHLCAPFLLTYPKVASSPSPRKAPPGFHGLIPPLLPEASGPQTAALRFFAPAYFTHQPGHSGWGTLSEALSKPLAQGSLGL